MRGILSTSAWFNYKGCYIIVLRIGLQPEKQLVTASASLQTATRQVRVMKICSKCGKEKDIDKFSKDSQKKDGLRSSCKSCKSLYDKIYVEKNKEYKYEKNKEYRGSRKAEKAKYDKEYREANKEHVLRRKREYYHFNGGSDANKVWRKKNKELVRSYAHNAKAKRRSLLAESSLTNKQLTEWKIKQEKVCSYCLVECKHSYHIDHIMPLTRGGKHEITNLTISCPQCNHSKGNKTIDEWSLTRSELNISRRLSNF